MQAAAKAATFFLKVFPMLPSKPIDWVTKTPVVERVRYPARIDGRLDWAEGDLYRPAGSGPHSGHAGIVVCLGVVPFGVDHPQVPRLGEALARAGFAALLYWSPTMRDMRLDPVDIENIALAYRWLLEQPYVDPARSGLLGTCVGGSFALMASANPLIRDKVGFVTAYAPYSSMLTLARDIATSTCTNGVGRLGEVRKPWQVDQLTRKVYVRSITAQLPPSEAALLRDAFSEQASVRTGYVNSMELSEEGRAVYPLLTHLDAGDVDAALARLPADIRERLATMSPITYLKDIHAPLVVLCHDSGDKVVPVGESRRLVSALFGRPGVRYTELAFQHLNPARLPLLRLLRELAKFYRAVYPLFRQAVA